MNSLLNSSLGFAYRPSESISPRLWNGLRLCAAPCLGFGGRNLSDLSPSRFDLAITGTAYSIGMSPIGQCLTFTGNAAMQQSAASWGLPCKFGTNSYDDAIFIHAYFKFTHSAAPKESTLFWSDNPTVGASQYGYRLYVDNNADKLKLAIANGDLVPTTTPTVYTSAGTLVSGRWYHVIVGWWPSAYDTGGGPSDACRMWIDGTQDGLPTVTNSSPSGVEEFCSHLATQNARIGSTLGSISPDFSIALLNIWSRGLSDAEVLQISVDPLVMFRKFKAKLASKPAILGGASLTCEGTLACVGSMVQKSGGSLTNENAITCTGKRVQKSGGSLVNENIITCTGKRIQKGSTLLQGDATFTCTGRRVQQSGCSLIEEFSVTCSGRRMQKSGGSLVCESSLACAGRAVFKGAATLICEAYLLCEVGEVYDVWNFDIAMRSELQDLYAAGVGVAREVVAEGGIDTVVVAGTGRAAEHITRTELEFSCER